MPIESCFQWHVPIAFESFLSQTQAPRCRGILRGDCQAVSQVHEEGDGDA